MNDVGMVAWLVTLRTPEYPDGRQIILIANDITHQVRGGEESTSVGMVGSCLAWVSGVGAGGVESRGAKTNECRARRKRRDTCRCCG